jgi:hypothetical protein
MGLGWIALEPVDQAGLRRAQRQPITSRLLQRNEERPDANSTTAPAGTPNTISIWSVMACRTNLEGFAAYQ